MEKNRCMKNKEKDNHELTKQGYKWHTHSWLENNFFKNGHKINMQDLRPMKK